MRKLKREEIEFKAYNAIEEEGEEAKDFLERNIDKIVTELLRIEVNEENFLELLRIELEKYEEYLKL